MTDENNKKLQYLKRGDVRTMDKDIGRLREKEAEITREKIVQLKTGEEAQREAERLAQLQKAAEARKGMETEIKKGEEELQTMKEEREKRVAAAEVASAEEEEREKERLRTQFKEAQTKEEEERRKFLESVALKAGEKPPESREIPTPPPIRPVPPPLPPRPAPPEPMVPPKPPAIPPEPSPIIPPPPPSLPAEPLEEAGKKPFKFLLPKIQIPKVSLPKIQLPRVQIPKVSLPKVQVPKVEGYFPTKPSIFEKIWIRIIISLFVLAVLATIATFWYWYLVVRVAQTTPTVIEKTETVVPEEPKITQSFIGVGYYFPDNPRVIDTIIIHSGFNTSNGDPYDMEGIIQSYKKAQVATHYLISREGDIFQLAPDYAIAFHAGAGKMPDGRIGVNNFSIGISLVYQEAETPNEIQYQSLSWLVKELQGKYNIPSENILGYKDVAAEKTTPWNFEWEKLKLLFSSLSASPTGGAEFILKSLTLEEKIGQLLIIGFEESELTPQLEDFIKTVHPGGIILFKKNIVTASQVKKLIQDLQKISLTETGLPLLVAVDQEGGVVSRINFIKEKTGQAEIENTEQAYGVGYERGEELKKLGINLNFAPLLDLTQNGDFLHERSFQKNPEETGKLAKALTLGQKAAGIFSAIKHFPGYGGITFNPEEQLAALAGTPQIVHFREAIGANPEFVMLASIVYDSNMPIAFSKKGIAFLKQELGEGPLIITDDLSQPSFVNNFYLKEIVTLPIKAGADILLFSGQEKDASATLIRAVRDGDMPEKTIDRAVLRIIQLKQSL